jgi:hypothetical protein
MNAAGKATVACFALVALFVGTALYVRHRNRQLDSDDKSVHTQWSNKTDDNSYLRPDWHDLLFRHSKMDVHKCKSAMCEVCQPNLGLVHTVRVPRGANVKSLRLDDGDDVSPPQYANAVADAPSKSSSSRRSLEPLGNLEPITQEDVVPSSSPKASNSNKSSWLSFGKGRTSHSAAHELEDDNMLCQEVTIHHNSRRHILDDDSISFVASSTRSDRSSYSGEVKEIVL